MTKTRNLSDLLDANGKVDNTDILNVDAAKITTGTLADARLPANALNSNVDLTTLSASNLTSGTLADARFPSTLPAVSGANLTNLPGGGKILQVVYGTSSTQFSVSSPTDGQYEFPSSNKISAVITPSASNSKIFVQYTSNCRMSTSTDDMGIALGLKETISGSSATVIGGVAYSEGLYSYPYMADDVDVRLNQFILRTPSTTNAITYEVGLAGYHISSMKLNNSDTEGRIILMEISG